MEAVVERGFEFRANERSLRINFPGRTYIEVTNGGQAQLAAPIDTRLYLPKEWSDDGERREKAGIPACQRVFKTKKELALEIVSQARSSGVRFGWVGADAGYGSGSEFLFALDNGGETFLIDVHKSFAVHELDPHPILAEPTGKGRKRSRLTAQHKSRSVEANRDFETAPEP
jgi:SRSO17 transposase